MKRRIIIIKLIKAFVSDVDSLIESVKPSLAFGAYLNWKNRIATIKRFISILESELGGEEHE